MKSIRSQLAQLPVIKFCCSIRITVVCLFLLFVLTFWGTIYQAEHGLYYAQERFFYSLFFPVFGFFPFPGARLVMWILFINLLHVAVFRFPYRWSHAGILIIHSGLLLMLVSAFMTFYFAQESHLTLLEGEGSNTSESYHGWELAVWKGNDLKRQVTAYDADKFFPGKLLDFNEHHFDAVVEAYYPNSDAFVSNTDARGDVSSLKPVKPLTEPEKNIAGAIVHVRQNGKELYKILLYGGQSEARSFAIDGENYSILLRHRRFALPFVVKLLDFRMQVHPGTEVARSYESEVEVITPDSSRRTVIFMNNPLRHKDFTFYQASYSVDALGRESSTLAVVKNSGRILPYVSSLMTALGLIVHFLVMFLKSRKLA